MANSNPQGDGVPPRNPPPVTKKTNWMPWLLLALGLIALLFGLRSCRNNEVVATGPLVNPADVTPAPGTPAPVPAPAMDTVAVLPGTSGLGSYLAGTEAVPRTFVFEKLNFDSAKSDIRAEDRAELAALAAAMKQYPNARIRIVGYADARGDAIANATLGKERAENVKRALLAEGIPVTRVETASGGEVNPVDTNVTTTGQAENRRAEVIVLQR